MDPLKGIGLVRTVPRSEIGPTPPWLVLMMLGNQINADTARSMTGIGEVGDIFESIPTVIAAAATENTRDNSPSGRNSNSHISRPKPATHADAS